MFDFLRPIRGESEFSIEGNRSLVGLDYPDFHRRIFHFTKRRNRCVHEFSANATVPEFFKRVDRVDFANAISIQVFVS